MKRIIISSIILIFYFSKIFAQQTGYPIAPERQYVHYNLNKIKKQFLGIDGRADNELKAGNNEEINLQITYAATVKVDALQQQIELDKTLSNTQKITYLRGLGEMLVDFGNAFKKKKIKLIEFPQTLKAWESAFMLDKQDKPIDTLIANYSLATGNIIIKGISFTSNSGIPAAKNWLVLKYIEENPGKLLQALNANPDLPFTDSLIALAAKKEPEKLYSYAQAANTKFGKLIQQHSDPAVKLVCTLANDNSGRLYFPFLDNLLKEKMTIEDIKKNMRDSLSYYRLLVRTQIDYAGRMAKGDTPIVSKTLRDMIRTKAVDPFVNTINGLHDAPDAVRFKILDQLTAPELYYLIVSCESEIYTSSYIGVYNRIWHRMTKPSADSLLAAVNNDHYKKFITMAANYNKLDDFLSKMSNDHANNLMTNFVNNLDKGKGDDLEDAVDVANSYASITNDTIKKLMLEQISKNYNMAETHGNKRGEIIYRLEKLILESSNPASNINLTEALGILPVYDVKNEFLRDSLGRIVLQMYFYGDKSGMGIFESFKNIYSNKNWKVNSTPEWIQFTSVNSKVPFVIFANRALDELENLDDQAQDHLNNWMEENGFQPSITVHRGHSYYLPYTVKKLSSSNKIIILGSCGAYHSMKSILEICPDAYLIASKQVGYGEINAALFTTMIDELRNGHDINWEAFWKKLQAKIRINTSGFDDYVPPYKNLGAIFIKAYAKAIELKEE